MPASLVLKHVNGFEPLVLVKNHFAVLMVLTKNHTMSHGSGAGSPTNHGGKMMVLFPTMVLGEL